MPTLVIATSAVDAPMGAQVYQEAVTRLAPATLGPSWEVVRVITRSMRSPLPGTHRIPGSRLGRAPAPARKAVGRLLYPTATVVHRMDLELPPAPRPEVVTLHDVIAWKYADESPPVPAAMSEIRRAAAVICVSSYTAQEAVSLLGIQNPVVVPNGVADDFFDAPALAQPVLAALGITGPFVLASGGASERKNLASLAAAWRHVNRARFDLTLVLTGPPHPRRTELFRNLPQTLLAGRVADELMPGLISSASCVVIPSREEGFGLPALEAMAALTPVVAADTSSLPEVVGDAGLLVAPTPEGIAEGILHAVSDSSDVATMVERGSARARRFTWQASAERHAEVWLRVAATT